MKEVFRSFSVRGRLETHKIFDRSRRGTKRRPRQSALCSAMEPDKFSLQIHLEQVGFLPTLGHIVRPLELQTVLRQTTACEVVGLLLSLIATLYLSYFIDWEGWGAAMPMSKEETRIGSCLEIKASEYKWLGFGVGWIGAHGCVQLLRITGTIEVCCK